MHYQIKSWISLMALELALSSTIYATQPFEEKSEKASYHLGYPKDWEETSSISSHAYLLHPTEMEVHGQELNDIAVLRDYMHQGNLEISPNNVEALLEYGRMYATAFRQYDKDILIKEWDDSKNDVLKELLKAFTKLTRMKINISKPSKDLITILEKSVQFYTHLKKINFSNCNLTEENVENLRKSLKDALQLTKINLRGNATSPTLEAKFKKSFPNLLSFKYDFDKKESLVPVLPVNNDPSQINVLSGSEVGSHNPSSVYISLKDLNSNNNNVTVSSVNPPEENHFKKRSEDKKLQANTLIDTGIRLNEDNLAARFLTVDELCQRLKDNAHGLELNLSQSSFKNEGLDDILHSVNRNQSVQKLNLANSLINVEHYTALSNLLAQNSFLKELDLTQTSWPNGAFKSLLIGLELNKGLSFLNLRPAHVDFSNQEIELFYNNIKTNTTLRLVVWPENKNLISVLQKLASNNSVAALHLGIMYREGVNTSQDAKKAMEYLQKAAQLGHPAANYELGVMHEKTQPKIALNFYTTASNQGSAKSDYALARYHRREWGSWSETEKNQPNYDQTFFYCKKAADKNEAEAQYRLARMYEDGRSVPKNPQLSESYFSKAAIQGHYGALRALGGLYAQQGDKVKAERYLNIAKEFDPAAKRFLIQLQKEQSSEQ